MNESRDMDVARALQGMPADEHGADFWSGLEAKLAEEATRRDDQARPRARRDRLLLVAAVVVAIIAAAVGVAVVLSSRSGGDGASVVAEASPSASAGGASVKPGTSAMRGGMRPQVLNDVTVITQMGLDAGAQPWIGGRLGEIQPSFAAYLSGGTWQQLPIPAGFKNVRVQTALSPSDAWATVTSGFVHWDGASWQETSVSWLDEDVAWMDAMAASATNDVWAVGHKAGRLYKTPADGPGEHTQGQLPATMHWDGASWTEVTVPPAPGRTSTLYGVSSRGGETWAVGWYQSKVGEVAQEGGGLPHELVRLGPIALRWQGERWVEIKPRNSGGGGTALLSVLVLGRDDVWVLGATNRSEDPSKDADVGSTYLAHWDGSSWQRLATPRGPNWGDFASIGGTSDDDLWLGGSSPGGLGYPETAHWDGEHWTVYGPEAFKSDQAVAGKPGGVLGASEPEVAAASPTDVWFNAGFTRFWYSASSEDQRQVDASASDPMLFHWDGRSWSKVQVGF